MFIRAYYRHSRRQSLIGLTIERYPRRYVAVAQHAPFFDLAKRIAAFRDELIRSLPARIPAAPFPLAPFRFPARAKRFSIISADRSSEPEPRKNISKCGLDAGAVPVHYYRQSCVRFSTASCASRSSPVEEEIRPDKFLPDESKHQSGLTGDR